MTETIAQPSPIKLANDSQLSASDPTISAFVSANAGSGKTKVLIDRVARLLLQDAQPDEILCVTYTKAAAAEMKTRLFQRLGSWSVADDERLTRELMKLNPAREGAFSAKELGRARSLFAQALETPGGLKIETLHAFCVRLLKRFPLEAGVTPGLSLMEESEAKRIKTEAIGSLLREAAHDAQLRQDVYHMANHDPIKERLAALLDKRDLLGKFIEKSGGIEKAINELRSCLDVPSDEATIISDLMAEMDFEAYRGLYRSLSHIRNELGTNDTKALNRLSGVIEAEKGERRFSAMQNFFLTSSLKPYNEIFTKSLQKSHPEIQMYFTTGDLDTGIEFSKFHLNYERFLRFKVFEQTAASLRVCYKLSRVYAQHKTRRGAIDFDDQISLATSLLKDKVSSDWVLQRLDGQLKHILLDEAQDTNPTQWQLINALSEDFFAGQSAHDDASAFPRTLFAVGDEKQSIFGFQGAAPEQFAIQKEAYSKLNPIETKFARDDGNITALNLVQPGRFHTPQMLVSFRSSRSVLKFVDAVFSRQEAALLPDGSSIGEHIGARPFEGRVEFWPYYRNAKEELDVTSSPVDRIPQTSGKVHLANAIAARIKEMMTDETLIEEEDEKGRLVTRSARPGDVLILCRKRKALYDEILRALQSAGLKFAGADRLQLKDSLAAQDVLNLIRVAIFPENNLALAELLKSPFIGLVSDNDDLFPLANDRGQKTLWARLCEAETPKYVAARNYIADLRAHRHLSPHNFLLRALNRPAMSGEGPTGHIALDNRFGSSVRLVIDTIMGQAANCEAKGVAGLQAFLLLMEQNDSDVKRELAEENDAIRVMTVHGAKGLEAPIVILPETTGPVSDKEEFKFAELEGTPVLLGNKKTDTKEQESLREASQDKASKEDKRLLYVALTRACNHLIICGAQHGYGRAQNCWHEICEKTILTLLDDQGNNETPPEERLMFPAMRSLEPVVRTAFSDDAPAKERAKSSYPASYPIWLDEKAVDAKPFIYTSPTSLARLGKERVTINRQRQERALLRGDLIHKLLEYLPQIEEGRREELAYAYLDKMTAAEDIAELAEEIMAEVFSLLTDENFAFLFGAGSHAELAISGYGRHLPDDLLISGQIDRLVETDEAVTLIDYKSDHISKDQIEEAAERHALQVALYRSVLQNIYGDKPIKCAILWTRLTALTYYDTDRLDNVIKDFNKSRMT